MACSFWWPDPIREPPRNPPNVTSLQQKMPLTSRKSQGILELCVRNTLTRKYRGFFAVCQELGQKTNIVAGIEGKFYIFTFTSSISQMKYVESFISLQTLKSAIVLTSVILGPPMTWIHNHTMSFQYFVHSY